ncbi:hypothetical protein GCM10010254_11370 [Streptomyces chromofuscus]|nr:hypothetical protein GCM10010254_11370 [Streptomyces chromofuscus]
MNASYYRSQLDRKNKARADAERKVGDFRKKEADKRGKATKERAAAAKASSPSTMQSKLRTAQRYDNEANKAGHDASTWSATMGKLSKEAAELSAKLAKAEQTERVAAEKARQREQQQAERRAAAEQRKIVSRLSTAEGQVRTVLTELRAPKPEKLRVLLLGATSDGGLRVGREQERIRGAVQSATHRSRGTGRSPGRDDGYPPGRTDPVPAARRPLLRPQHGRPDRVRAGCGRTPPGRHRDRWRVRPGHRSSG